MQSCKAVCNHVLYRSCPGNPLTHPDGNLSVRYTLLISTAESRSQCRDEQISSSHLNTERRGPCYQD